MTIGLTSSRWRQSNDARKHQDAGAGPPEDRGHEQTEAAYDAHLSLLQHAGHILWRKFEGLKLSLADNTFYTPNSR